MEAFLILAAIVVLFVVIADKGDPPKPTTRPKTAPRPQHRPPQRPQTRSKWPANNGPTQNLPAMPQSGTLRGKCHVIDGDTIVIKRTKIRLAGIDAPELDQPWGQKSKWAMINLCKGKEITVKLNGERSHDRLVGTCFCPEGHDVGAELIKLGLALDWALFSGGKYRHLEPHGVRQKIMFTRYRSSRN